MASNTRLIVPLGPEATEGHMMVMVDANGDVAFEDSAEGDFTFHACDWDTIVAYVQAARTSQ